ncbi:hypothetical protein BsIDN1_14740 [Bacillus safensis]|uniref:Uncharacterized protein n=1 Tax=Bacillus safensis TaxID=561879 RepID=A0A5S9M8I4_BACIA|nr:hypothetical protein BsIDN1_14740 [Bacillus safensis]
MLNGLMAVPNLIGLIGLSGVVVFESKRIIDKIKQEKKGEKHLGVVLIALFYSFAFLLK